jgi:hypothetical protein
MGDYLEHVTTCPDCGDRWCTKCEVHWAQCSCPGPHEEDDMGIRWEPAVQLDIREHSYAEREGSEEDRCPVVGDLVHYYYSESRIRAWACIVVAELREPGAKYVALQPLKYHAHETKDVKKKIEMFEPIIVDAFGDDLVILQELKPFESEEGTK